MTAKLAIPAVLFLSACAGSSSAPSDTTGSTEEAALAKATLNGLQQRSFAANTEFCGYIVRRADGTLVATPAVQGDFQSCLPADPGSSVVIQASYHTHGAFEIDTPAEYPSSYDLLGDNEEGIDGYISTPGGRIWYVDGSDLVASQLCGIGCVAKDPRFQAGVFGPLDPSYTYNQLQALEQE